MNPETVYPVLESHLTTFFAGHAPEVFVGPAGPIHEVLPRFRVLRFAPGPRTIHWVYASLGTWEVDAGQPRGLEFFVIAPGENQVHVEFLAMAAHYHLKQKLGKWHSFPIGRPWLPGSQLDHVLVSLPYPFGADLEICEVPGGHIHFLWLLPISATERALKKEHGVDALEDLLEAKEVDYADPMRTSVA
jgi:hypothetical protein